ncbi:hypothetical protein HDU78_005544 [Chytriomyces hyalinus]|nr:hypothetical protein HDU78_005544 [Chytriomyces hyalinus]
MANSRIPENGRRRTSSAAAAAGGHGEERRLMQNRLAQRAYRERKDNRIKELEAQIAELEHEIAQARSLAESTGEGSSPCSTGSSQSSSQTMRSPSTQSNTSQPHGAPTNHDIHHQQMHNQSCDSCDLEKFNSARMVAQLTEVESKLSLMHSQNQSLKIFISAQEVQMKSLLGYSDPLMLQDTSSLMTMTMPFENHQIHSSQLASPTNQMPMHMPAMDNRHHQSNILTQYQSPFETSNSVLNHYLTSGPSLNSMTSYADVDWNSLFGQTPQPPIEVERDVREDLVSKFGVVDVEWSRQALKGLKSLVNSSDVDELVDAFIMQTETTDPTVLQLCLIRLSKMKGRILDACTQNDKMRAIEIMGKMRSKNQNYVDRLFAEVIETAASQKKANSSSSSNSSSSKERPDASSSSTMSQSHTRPRSANPVIIPTSQNTSAESIPDRAPEYTIFRQACLFVPALNGHGHLIDELIELFMVRFILMQLKLQDPIEKKEAFFRMVKVRSKMESLCQTDEDRNKNWDETGIDRM